MRSVQSALAWVGILSLIFLMLPTVALVWLFDRTPHKRITGRTFRVMGSWITRVNPRWRVTISGEIPPASAHPFVVVSNHQSNADIPAISRLPWEMKWVGKKSLFALPVAGWMMRMSNDIAVDRKDPDSRANVLRRSKAVLASGLSVMIMPEGTRSRDTRLLRYQDGAFRLAVETGLPILPLAIEGSAEALPKHGWRFGHADVKVHVFDPVETTGLTAADVPALRERVRQMTAEQLAAWRGVAPEAVDSAPEQRADLTPEALAPGASGDGALGGEERAKMDAPQV